MVAVTAHQALDMIAKPFPCDGIIKVEIGMTAIDGRLIMNQNPHLVRKLQIEARIGHRMQAHRVDIAILDHAKPCPRMTRTEVCNTEKMT